MGLQQGCNFLHTQTNIRTSPPYNGTFKKAYFSFLKLHISN